MSNVHPDRTITYMHTKYTYVHSYLTHILLYDGRRMLPGMTLHDRIVHFFQAMSTTCTLYIYTHTQANTNSQNNHTTVEVQCTYTPTSLTSFWSKDGNGSFVLIKVASISKKMTIIVTDYRLSHMYYVHVVIIPSSLSISTSSNASPVHKHTQITSIYHTSYTVQG